MTKSRTAKRNAHDAKPTTPPHTLNFLQMDKNRILAILRSHAPELQAAGIAHLRLFGSVAGCPMSRF